MAQHNAAFINAIADEGDKTEAVFWLQRTWDDLMNLRLAMIKLGWTSSQIQAMMDKGRLDG